MDQICLFMKRRVKIFLLALGIFSLLLSGCFFGEELVVKAAGESGAVIQTDVYHQHTDGCYSMQRCGGSGRQDEYMVKGCSCNMEHPCIEHGCYWEEPNSLYPTGCWHCYCPKAKQWICTTCQKIIPGSSCDNETRQLSCGKEGSVTAHITLDRGTSEWCTQLELRADVELTDVELTATPYVWDGTPTDQNVYTVTENGMHTFELQADANSNTAAAVITVLINNIDTTGPQIIAYKQEPSEGWSKEPVKLIITEIQDLQPDGSQGCGTGELPLSFQGGDWTANRVFICEDSGTYTVLLQDALGNVAEEQVTVSHVDVTGPAVEFQWDQTLNLTEVWVEVLADDIQKDGSAGCGLAALPYSYDQGMTWTDEPSFWAEENGIYTVLVKDMIGNITEAAVEITNLDKTGPVVNVMVSPEEWYGEGNVTITVEAVDEGSGLDKFPYSWDGGETWTEENEKETEEAGSYTILVKDANGNITECEVKVTINKQSSPDLGSSDSGSSAGNADNGSGNNSNGNNDSSGSDSENSSFGDGGEDSGQEQENSSGVTIPDGSISGNGEALEDNEQEEAGNNNGESGNAAGSDKKNSGADHEDRDDRKFSSKTEWKPYGSEHEGKIQNHNTDDKEVMGTDDNAETAEVLEIEESTVKEEKALAQNDQKDNLRRSILKTEAAKAVTIAASTALLISVAGLLCFLLLMGILVYDDKGDGHYRMLGMRICRRQEGGFMLSLPRSMTEKSETGRYRLCPGILFAIMNQDEEMLVESEEEQRKVSVKIAKKMEIRL